MKIFRLTAESTHYNNDLAIDIGFAIRKRWILLLLLVLLAIAALWVFTEPPRSAEANQWISQATEPPADELEAYQHLLGISASVDEEPDEFGARQLIALEAGDPQPVSRPSLKLPSGELYCRVRQEDCLKRQMRSVGELRMEVSTHAVLLERVRKFVSLQKYQSVAGLPDTTAERPFAYLLSGDKLIQFDIIADALSGEVTAATTNLEDHISNLRKMLAEVDSLPLKMQMVTLLIDNLDLVAGLYAQGLLKAINTLTELTPQENSMNGPLRQQFLGHVEVFERLADANSNSNNGNGSAKSDIKSYISQKTFSANRAVNAAYSEYRKLLVKASLPTIIVDEAFAGSSGQVSDIDKPLLDLANITGTAFDSIERVELALYLFRLRDLDCKLKLLRIRMTTGSLVSEPFLESIHDSVDLSNPYNPSQTVVYDSEKKQLCYQGPRPDYHGTRCIFVK